MKESFLFILVFSVVLVNRVFSTRSGDCSFSPGEKCNYTYSQDEWHWNERTDNIDHTSGSGGYLHASVSDSTKNDFANATSPTLLPTGIRGKCLTFWYQIVGKTITALRVRINHPNTPTTPAKDIWEDKLPTGNDWHFGRIPIVSTLPYRVTFEAERTKSMFSAYASLDDIIFTEGPCSIAPFYTSTTDTFKIPERPSKTYPPIVPVLYPSNCTFEKNDMCFWTHSPGNAFNWTLQRGGSAHKTYSGPSNDHSIGQYKNGLKGYYLYIKPTDKQLGQKARFESKEMSPEDGKCLVFWYHMWGANINTLNVYLSINNKTSQPLWTRKKTQGKRWNRAAINFSSQKNFKIVFEGVTSNKNIMCNIAVDDIIISPSPCPIDPNICDFEDLAICRYHIEDSSKWFYSGGKAFSGRPVIDYDHTYGEYGHYLAVTNNSAGSQFTTKVSSPAVNLHEGDKCLRFWYYVTKGMSSQLYVTMSNSNEKLFTSDAGIDFGDQWQVAQVSIDSASVPAKLQFNARAEKGEKFTIAIDDVEVRNGFCGDKADCNFEYGDLCTWTNGNDDDFDWTLISGRTETENVGPSYDNTLENVNGTYLYIETSKPQKAGQKARFYSQGFKKSTTPLCLHFWFNMNGDSIGRLTVFQKFSDGSQDGLWQLRGDQSSFWLYGRVPVSRVKNSFQLVFEATVGGEWGDIALDDIVISENDCSIEPTNAKYVSPAPTTTSRPPTIPPKQLYELIDCSFSENYCEWLSPPDSSFDWKIGNLSKNTDDDRSPYIPPIVSRFQNSYIYVESGLIEEKGQKAVLVSKLLTTTKYDFSLCFTFIYYMFGSRVGNLTIHLDDYHDGNLTPDTVVLWKRINAQPDVWQRGSITINMPNKKFKIRIEAQIDFDAVIAMDNFELQMTQCQSERLCDFSSDLCMWTNDNANPLTWARGKPNVQFGPPVDHTTLTENGHYLYLQNDPSIAPDRGQFVSYLLNKNFGTQCFSFWYDMQGNESDGSLVVRLHTYKFNETITTWETIESKPLWQRSLHPTERWRRAQVTISSYEQFRISLEGSFDVLTSVKDYIAVDDFQILPYPCDHPGSCSFDSGLCGYTNEIDDNFNWMVGRGQTMLPNLIVGPPFDASGQGMYAYADFTSNYNGKYFKSFLRSDEIVGSPQFPEFCLQFSYLMFGKEPMNLQVALNKLDITSIFYNDVLWSSTSVSGTTWKKVNVKFNSTVAFELIFITQKLNAQVFIGIDEISVTPGATCTGIEEPTNQTQVPAEIFSCDFESSKMCKDWNDMPQSSNPSFANWTKRSGVVGKAEEGPYFDHTKKNSIGQYLIVMSLSWQKSTARLISNSVTDTHKSCFQFWYLMNINNDDSLNIIVRTEDKKEKIVWTRKGMSGKVWRLGQVDINAINFQVIIEGIVEQAYHRYIAVDDVKILTSECPEATTEFCTFDDGHMCFFKTIIDGNFNWNVTNSKKPQHFPKDHTTGTSEGNYLYLNTTGRYGHQTAIIASSLYPAGDICVNFWYYMSKSDAMLTLQLDKRFQPIEYVKDFELISKEDWVRASYTVTSNTPFEIRFLGLSSTIKSEVDVAIDDVEITKGKCQHSNFCDFEYDFCSWENDLKEAKYEWFLSSSLIYKNSDLPKTDHSSGLSTGSYLSVINEDPTNSNIAILKSTLIPIGAKCFSFWYNAQSSTVGSILVTYSASLAHEEHLGTVTISKTNQWVLASFDLNEISKSAGQFFMLRITFLTGSDIGYLSLDDVLIENEYCDFSIADTFQCDDGKTSISKSEVCDYVYNCYDKSDELNCGSCDFENGTCNYTDASLDLFRWTSASSATAADLTGNIINTPDHTVGNKTGHFMFVNTHGILTLNIAKAVLHSPRLRYSSATCHLSFWQYNVPAEYDAREVEVDVVYDNDDDTFEIHHGRGEPGTWTRVDVFVGRIHRPFTISFSVTESYNDDGIVAIDDIKMISCGPPENAHRNCTSAEIRCKDSGRSPCISNSYECDFTDDCTNGKDELDCETKGFTMCHFDDGSYCVWEYGHVSSRYGNWKVVRAYLGYYGPMRDHTTNSPEGYYLTTSGVSAKIIRAISRPLRSKNNTCIMRFYYYFQGDSKFKFRIFTWTSVNGEQTEWFKRDRFWGDYFIRDEIQFSIDGVFQIILEATLEDHFANVILDDFSFTSNCIFDDKYTMPLKNVSIACPNDYFLCDVDKCIDSSLICNFAYDCKDKSDELNCAADCDFENKTCGWSDSSVGAYRWFNVKAIDTSQPHNTPEKDHTNDRMTGWYMSVIKTHKGYSAIPSAYLETPVLGMTASSCKFSFAYHTSGVLKLNVRNFKNNFEKTLQVLEKNKPQEWTVVNVSLGRLDPGYQIVFEAVVINEHVEGNLPDFVIDDAKFKDCSSEKENANPSHWVLNCTFEKGLAAWYQEHVNDEIDWSLGSGETPTKGTGPQYDHTNVNGTGHYLYIENSEKYNDFTSDAWLRSPVMPKTSGSCLRFWYHMFGEHVGSLEVNVVNANDTDNEKLWKKSGSQGNTWRSGSVNIVRDQPYQIIFRGVLGIGYKNNIALDDITYVHAPCQEPQNSCDFELSNCGWIEGTSFYFPWTWGKAREVAFQTDDHTTGTPSGHVLYFKSMIRPNGFNTTEVVSNLVQRRSSSRGACFQFWYLMATPHRNSYLTVKALSEEKNISETVSVLYSDDWYYGQMNIPPNIDFTLQIDITASAEAYAPEMYVLVDDIIIRNESCLSIGSCDFESDFCGWTHAYHNGEKLTWLRSSAKTPSEYSGPTVDHTLGTPLGFYLFLDSSWAIAGTASIESFQLTSASGIVCFSFYYHMFGEEVGKLTVWVISSDSQYATVFSISGDKGDKWHPVHLEIHNVTDKYFLNVEGELNGLPNGDIAIDDFNVTDGQCPKEPIPNITITTTIPPVTTTITKPITTQSSTSSSVITTKQIPPVTSPTSVQSSTVTTQSSSTSSTGIITSNVPEVTSTSSKVCGRGQLRCGSNDTCIKSSYWCDGVRDCPNNADENSCPPKRTCGENQIPCASLPDTCIDKNWVCDGRAHCKDQSDESQCSCDDSNFCTHDSSCYLSDRVPVCKCGDEYNGNRCQFAAQVSNKSPETNNGWIAAVVIGVILLIGVLGYIYVKKFRPQPAPAEPNTMSIDNPIYELSEQENYQSFGLHESDTSVPEPIDEVDKGIVNPLYE